MLLGAAVFPPKRRVAMSSFPRIEPKRSLSDLDTYFKIINYAAFYAAQFSTTCTKRGLARNATIVVVLSKAGTKKLRLVSSDGRPAGEPAESKSTSKQVLFPAMPSRQPLLKK